MENTNPLRRIYRDFEGYVAEKNIDSRKHMLQNRLPDYAFGMDMELRKRLDAIPKFYSLAQTICGTYANRMMHEINMTGVAVGPNQFPEIYAIGRDCARRLGIGVPNIYIISDPTLNAATMATDDIEPFIYLHSGIVERMTQGELRTVIGHECGHIQNKHTVYNLMAQLVISGAQAGGNIITGKVNALLSTGMLLALSRWERAAEVTCDRASVICADNVEDAISAQAKLMQGGMLGKDWKMDLDSLMRQFEQQKASTARLNEMLFTHPSGLRRIAAIKIFSKCETLFGWRPEFRKPGMRVLSRDEAEQQCNEVVSLLSERDLHKGKRKNGKQ